MSIEIWTDGSCDHHDYLRPGGWSYLIIDNVSGFEFADSGGCLRTTNNQMELNAILEALWGLILVNDSASREIIIHPDSEWAIKCLTREYDCTKKQKKTGKQGGHVAWLDAIWGKMQEYDNIKFEWIRGHADNPNNARANAMAVRMMNYARTHMR